MRYYFTVNRHFKSKKILTIILMKKNKNPERTNIFAESIFVFNLRTQDGSKFCFTLYGKNQHIGL